MSFHDLIAHKGFADAALLQAIAQHPAASSDVPLRTLLHHMLVANRFWLLSIVGEPFDSEIETRVPDSLDAVIAGFRATHARETEWLARTRGDALSQTLVSALIPGGRCVVSDALLQVCLHSQGTARSARRCCVRSAAFRLRTISFSGVWIGRHRTGRPDMRLQALRHATQKSAVERPRALQ